MEEALIEQAAYLTPTTLFILLNFVIATILVSSKFTNPPQLALTPSLFSRVASFNFSNYHPDDNHQEQHQLHSSPSLFSRVASFDFSGRANEPYPFEASTREGTDELELELELKPALALAVARAPCLLSLKGRDQQVEVGEVHAHCDSSNKKVVKKNKKKKVEGKETMTFKGNDQEVDAKADDFIIKFKQQLKLQRIESLMRYRNA